MERLTISEVAERHLDLWADQLQRGELSIWQLPLAVQQFYFAGEADARLILNAEIRQLEHALDIAYMRQVAPAKRQADFERRLNEYYALEADELMTALEAAVTGNPALPEMQSDITTEGREPSCSQPMTFGTLAPHSQSSVSRPVRAA